MIYFILNQELNVVKIGYTEKNVKRRLAQLQTGNASLLLLLSVLDGDREVEKILHERFAEHRKTGEWFTLNKELVNFINNANSDVVKQFLLETPSAKVTIAKKERSKPCVRKSFVTMTSEEYEKRLWNNYR